MNKVDDNVKAYKRMLRALGRENKSPFLLIEWFEPEMYHSIVDLDLKYQLIKKMRTISP